MEKIIILLFLLAFTMPMSYGQNAPNISNQRIKTKTVKKGKHASKPFTYARSIRK